MGFLDYRFKLPVHIVEFILIVGVCAISTARLFLPGVTTKTRANTIALGFVSLGTTDYYGCNRQKDY